MLLAWKLGVHTISSSMFNPSEASSALCIIKSRRINRNIFMRKAECFSCIRILQSESSELAQSPQQCRYRMHRAS